MLNGKAWKNENKDPTKKCQQEQRPRQQHQSDPYWNPKDGWQTADPG
jgi:hypothetical protein